jgi:uncharacterized lipoprotein YddW (UPF0748 family)
VQLHVWKVNWNLNFEVPSEFVGRMRQEHRLQANSQGKEQKWLCPSHPANQKLEIESLLEIVRNYDVDGIHFDYIRYPDGDHCFCPGCKERFEHALGVPVQNWPQDLLGDGPLRQRWLDWRRGNINDLVKAVSEQVRAIKPKVRLSAAVFRDWPIHRDEVGQDWKVWCEKGWLDYICPMDYNPSNRNFENIVAQQVRWVGRFPCYPGIGVNATMSHLDVDGVIDQIQITRRCHTGGFALFCYGLQESESLVRLLGLGETKPAE